MYGCEFVGEQGLGGSVVVSADKGLLIPFHPIPKTKKTFSGEDARTQYAKRAGAHLPLIRADYLVRHQVLAPQIRERLRWTPVGSAGSAHWSLIYMRDWRKR